MGKLGSGLLQNASSKMKSRTRDIDSYVDDAAGATPAQMDSAVRGHGSEKRGKKKGK